MKDSYKFLLNQPYPKDEQPSQRWFYDNLAQPLIPITVNIMMQGIKVDQAQIEALRTTVCDVLEDVDKRLATNPIIKKFQTRRYQQLKKSYILEREEKKRSTDYYKADYKSGDMVHRSFLMEEIAKTYTFRYTPEGQLPIGISKWSVTDIKRLLATANSPQFARILISVIEKTISPKNQFVESAMRLLAVTKSALYNQKYIDDIENVSPETLLPTFNPGSSLQKQQLFDYLDIPCEAFSKDTGLPSWERAQVERVNKETDNDAVKHFTQAFIDHSFSAIIRNNFIAAFDKYVIDGTLYGNIKLGGAKSFRLTSQRPNLLNMPSSTSIYAKPLKKCLVAPEGFLVAGSDYGALEEVVSANITLDENKIKIMSGMDSHCFHTLYYWREEVEKYLGKSDDSSEYNKKFKNATKTIPELNALRSKSKPVSFGLAYGCAAPKVAASIKGTFSEGEAIFNRYHNELYPGITDYRENYVLTSTKANGYIHLGHGLRLKSSNPYRDIRTLNNATMQYWSVLTLISILRMDERIKEAGLEADIQCISTIYDSIYYNVRNDPKIIKWLNDNLIEVMTEPFIQNQVVPNVANLDIGYSFAEQIELPNNATTKHISMQIEIIDSKATDIAIKHEMFIATFKAPDKTIHVSDPMDKLADAIQWQQDHQKAHGFS